MSQWHNQLVLFDRVYINEDICIKYRVSCHFKDKSSLINTNILISKKIFFLGLTFESKVIKLSNYLKSKIEICDFAKFERKY